MAAITISGEDAYASLRRNKAFRWAQHKPDSPTVPSRTRQVVLLPEQAPKFMLSRNDKIFTIGSCFARHVEAHLASFGYKFSTRDPKYFLPAEECTSGSGFYNKYTTHSILSEVEWALGGVDFPLDGYYSDTDGQWYDGQMPATFASLERAQEVRGNMQAVMSEAGQSDVLVLTLGLVEAWYDEVTKSYLNIAPSNGSVRKNPGRFSVHVLDYNDNLKALEKVYEIVTAANPSLKIVVTVSPVPLTATFTGLDISVANMYSKSTLRAVAGDFIARHPNVSYFSSYEAVVESHPLVAWMDDAIHVRQEMVNCVITHFLANFLDPEDAKLLDPQGAKDKLLKKLAEVSLLEPA